MEMKTDVRGEELQISTPKVGAEEVRRAMDILKKYKQGKKHLEQRIIDNEQFWKLRHWEQMEKAGEGGNSFDPRPRSGWLVNCILSKHADAMDAYPQPTVLPREADDREEARRLSRILPVILKNDRFRRTYSDGWWRKLKSGCAVYGVFWDGEKLGGMGDITVRSMDLLNLFWEPGITDVQKSAHFFSTELVDNDKLCAVYPQLKGKLSRSGMTLSRYLYDDAVDTSDKSVVVDWYYHVGDTLQFCKFVGEEVLYATENDPEMAMRGWYDHGKYPFVFDNLFPEEGTPCGYGYVDLCKSSQKQIDLMNQAILKNTLAAATPRFFIRDDGAVNENEYADWTRPFVHTNGNLGADSIAPIKTAGLDGVYVAFLNHKISEMKETAGNRDVSNGGTASGVTAATAIAALQESGGKLSRNMIDDSYEAFSDVVELCIHLIRQFYRLPRSFRLADGQGMEFITYDGAGLQKRPLHDGATVRYRLPAFDLEIGAEQESPYKTMEYNQLALQLYQMGFFREDMAAQARKCLELMEFKNKDTLLAAIAQPDPKLEIERLREQLLALSTAVDAEKGTALAASLRSEWAAQASPFGGGAAAGGGEGDDGKSSLPSQSASLTALPKGEPLVRSAPRGMAATMERSRKAARQTARPR